MSSLLIPVEMVGTSQWTVTQVLVDAGTTPGLGAQVVCMAHISRECMLGAVNNDGQDCWFSRNPMTPVGCSPRGLVLL